MTHLEPLNPFLEQIELAKHSLASLSEQESCLSAEIDWYDRLDRNRIGREASEQVEKCRQLAMDLDTADAELIKIQEQIQTVGSQVGTVFYPGNWFSRVQRELRQKRAELLGKKRTATAARDSTCNKLSDTRSLIENLRASIHRFDSFKRQEAERHRRDIRSQIASKEKELNLLAERKTQVDLAIAPHVREMQELISRKHQAEVDLEYAEDLSHQLSSASNGYERAMVHKECEEHFDTGSPGPVIHTCRKEIERIDRDHRKVEARIKAVARKAARQIQTIIIDGSNLCYEAAEFIGLAAIVPLAHELKRVSTVLIVFDSSIRRKLRADDRSLRSLFGDNVKVHIVASKQMADETILDLAAKSPETFVLSNDRFSEYNEKDAVRNSRVLRHEIVAGKVLIHDLDINLEFCY
jgi:hypothetical protein